MARLVIVNLPENGPAGLTWTGYATRRTGVLSEPRSTRRRFHEGWRYRERHVVRRGIAFVC